MSITTESCQQGQIESLKKQLAHKNNKFAEWTEENKELKEENEEWIEENEKLKAKNKGLTILKQEAESRSFCYKADIKELKEEIEVLRKVTEAYEDLMAGKSGLIDKNNELEKKSNAKSDIIRNMFDFITEDPEEVQEGFTINREWGHKYIDGWNDIVSEEMKAVVKDINKELDGDEMEWRTDGYEFSLHIKDEEEEVPEEEVPQGSKVDMEAFNKLKENGMMPWSK